MTPPRSANTQYLRVPVGPPQKYARPIFSKTKKSILEKYIGPFFIVNNKNNW